MERLVFRVCRTVSSEMGRRWNKLKMKYLDIKQSLYFKVYLLTFHSCGYRNRAAAENLR